MKPGEPEEWINHIRAPFTAIYSEDFSVVALTDGDEPKLACVFTIEGEMPGCDGVSRFRYVLSDVDTSGVPVGHRYENMAICCVCQGLARRETLRPCSDCGRLVHRECGRDTAEGFICKDDLPGLLAKLLWGAVLVPALLFRGVFLLLPLALGFAAWVLSPFVKFRK